MADEDRDEARTGSEDVLAAVSRLVDDGRHDEALPVLERLLRSERREAAPTFLRAALLSETALDKSFQFRDLDDEPSNARAAVVNATLTLVSTSLGWLRLMAGHGDAWAKREIRALVAGPRSSFYAERYEFSFSPVKALGRNVVEHHMDSRLVGAIAVAVCRECVADLVVYDRLLVATLMDAIDASEHVIRNVWSGLDRAGEGWRKRPPVDPMPFRERQNHCLSQVVGLEEGNFRVCKTMAEWHLRETVKAVESLARWTNASIIGHEWDEATNTRFDIVKPSRRNLFDMVIKQCVYAAAISIKKDEGRLPTDFRTWQAGTQPKLEAAAWKRFTPVVLSAARGFLGPVGGAR